MSQSQQNRLKELEWRVEIAEKVISLLLQGMSNTYIQEKLRQETSMREFVDFKY